MKKLLSLSVLAITAGATFPVYSAFDDAAEIPAVVVSAARTEQSTVTTPASITIITRQQIESSGARHITEVLRGQGVVQVTDMFGDGSRVSIGMRGFSETASSNTLVLIDGRRLNNTDISSPDLNSISLKDVERIEIIQGSAGVLFGDQAVGGVVNVITSGARDKTGLMELSVGSYNAATLRTVYSDEIVNNLHYRVSAELRKSDNYRKDNNEMDYTNLLAKTTYDYAKGNVFAEVQYVKEDLQTPGSLLQSEVDSDRRQTFVDFLDDYTDSETDVVRIGMAHNINSHVSFEGEVTHRDVEREIQQSFRGYVINVPSVLKRKQLEIMPRFVGAYPVENGEIQLTAGIDFIGTDFESGVTFSADKQVMLAEYIQMVLPATKKLNVTAGFRHAIVEDDVTSYFTNGKQDTSINVAELGLAYNVEKNIKYFARLDQNFRFAKVDELTYVSPGTQLKVQTGDSFEMGVEYINSSAKLKVVVYKLSLEDEIAFDPTATQPMGSMFAGANVNFDPTTHQGVIIESGFDITESLYLSGNYASTNATFDSGVFSGNKISGVAKNSARVNANYVVTDAINANVGVVYVGSHYLSGDNANALAKVSGYTVVDLNLAYDYKDWSLNLKVNNLNNRKYIENASSPDSHFPSPERNFLLTAAWGFR